MKYKIIDSSDDSYIEVFDEVLKENIVVHPGVRRDSKIEGNYLIAPDDDRYVKDNIHAIRCNCGVCTGLKTNFMDTVKEMGVPIVTINKDGEGK